MIKKEDWKTVEMPEQTEEFIFEMDLTEDEMELIREGRVPQQMEDKWFVYYENGKVFFHRSWTGHCIYIVTLSEDGKHSVVVNRNPEQYRETDLENDRLMMQIQMNILAGRKGKGNAELMKAYIARLNNTK